MGERSTVRYSPASAETLLAIPVLYLLAGQARALFPHTRTSSPSEKVVIARKGTIKQALCHFPLHVAWDQWEEAVVPVLEDEVLTVRAPLFKQALQDGRVEEWVNLIGAKLRQSFEAAGYGSS